MSESDARSIGNVAAVTWRNHLPFNEPANRSLHA
jgi:hypothetical protein